MAKKRAEKAGLPPGTPVLTEENTEPSRITILDYDSASFTEFEAKSAEECLNYMKKKKTVTWVNVDGLKDIALLQKLCEEFNIHPLVIEDILATDQRPKVENYDDYLYIVSRMLDFNGKFHVASEQISIILTPTFVISVQEKKGDLFESVRNQVRNNKGKLRKSGPDFLAYSLLDRIVDHYFIILEQLGERIEFMEEELVRSPTPKTLQMIHRMKRDMVVLRKSVWPMRELVSGLEREGRGDSKLIRKGTAIYLRDLYDHTIQVIDTIETYRDIVSGMLDIYLSSISYRLNEVMKVLTIIGTIFIPLTFVTGLYGMNFEYMPELSSPLGYPAVLLVMLIMGLVMLLFFRQRKWF
jgi:magnesium transporter